MIFELLSKPIAWYVAGPLIGLMVPILYILGNQSFGISSSFRHACAPIMPKSIPYFNYDWKKSGGWNLKFALGIVLGGFLASLTFPDGYEIALAESTKQTMAAEYGITDFSGLVPAEVFNWGNVLSFSGFFILIVGGLLIGFGTRYASGCTAGHGITGMANFQKASLIATIGFFIGGLISTYFILPNLLGGM